MEKYQWYQSFAPASLLLHSVKTGEQVREPSLVAVKLNALERRELPSSDERFHTSPAAIERCLAVGREALDYRDAPDAAVYSPLRCGQVADYEAARLMLKALWKRLRPNPLAKPVLCIHVQEYTTEVEEIALIDAAIQAGARRVLLYQQPFSVMLEKAQADPKLRSGYILHIEPQEDTGGR